MAAQEKKRARTYCNYTWIHQVLDRVDEFKKDGLGPPELSVSFALARRSDDAGESFPSQASLAADTLLSKRTVWKALRKLEQKGYLTIIPSAVGRGNRYKLTLEPRGRCEPELTNSESESHNDSKAYQREERSVAEPPGTDIANRLVEQFFELQGNPPRWKEARTAWATSFRQLLTQYSAEDLDACLRWSHEIDTFWPGKLIRGDRDPLQYFVSKIDTIMPRSIAYYRSLKNRETTRKQPASSSTTNRSRLKWQSAI